MTREINLHWPHRQLVARPAVPSPVNKQMHASTRPTNSWSRAQLPLTLCTSRAGSTHLCPAPNIKQLGNSVTKQRKQKKQGLAHLLPPLRHLPLQHPHHISQQGGGAGQHPDVWWPLVPGGVRTV